MPENEKAFLEFSKPFILDLAGHLKDAFLHTDIPTQADSMIPSDETFIQMAEYLDKNFIVTLTPLKKGVKSCQN